MRVLGSWINPHRQKDQIKKTEEKFDDGDCIRLQRIFFLFVLLTNRSDFILNGDLFFLIHKKEDSTDEKLGQDSWPYGFIF